MISPFSKTRWTALAEDLRLGVDSLWAHRLRALLTMLGMVFGVAAVVSMLSIGAGAERRVLAGIEQMGLRNLIVEARRGDAFAQMQRMRSLAPALRLHDLDALRDILEGVAASSPGKTFIPRKMTPRPERESPAVLGIAVPYEAIAHLRLQSGRFFTNEEDEAAAPVCVLGHAARANLFGAREAIGQYVRIDEQWLRVIGVAQPRLDAAPESEELRTEDANNIIYVPIRSASLRFEDPRGGLADEIDRIYLQLQPGVAAAGAARTARAVLDAAHHRAGDVSVVVPAELLAQAQRTRRIFDLVMGALASISLLVGGIGIMNIMLASILERTREIGIRRALGARRQDITRQFLTEAVLIALAGGLLGILLGFAMSRLIAWAAGWSTVVSPSSIVLAFVVSVSVGLVAGLVPAAKAAQLDPVEAMRNE
jgi:putative ABC transport system permease protein